MVILSPGSAAGAIMEVATATTTMTVEATIAVEAADTPTLHLLRPRHPLRQEALAPRADTGGGFATLEKPGRTTLEKECSPEPSQMTLF